MKKTTKRLVSAILSASMIFTSVYSSPVLAVSTSVDSVVAYATSGVFEASSLTAAADKEAVTADELTGIADGMFGVVGEVLKRTSGEEVKTVEVAKANGGAITVTVDGPATITALMASTGSSNTSAIGIAKSDDTIIIQDTVTGSNNDAAKEITATVEEAGTYKVMSPADDNNKRGARIYSITVTPAGGSGEATTVEATTEATTVEATTEATTAAEATTAVEATTAAAEATTEAPTETTTAAVENTTAAEATTTAEPSSEGTTTEPPVSSDGFSFVVGSDVAEGTKEIPINDEFFTAGDIATFKALQALPVTSDAEGTVDFNGKAYTAHFNSNSVQVNVDVDGSVKNRRHAFQLTALKDATVTVYTKVNNEKTVIIAESDKDGIADGDALTAAATEANTSGADKFVPITFEVKAGKYYYFLGEGTNPPIYAIDVVGKAAPAAGYKGDFEVARDVAADAKEVPINEEFFKAGDVAVFKALQALPITSDAEGTVDFEGQSFASHFNSNSVQVNVDVDGSVKNRRHAFQITALKDAKITVYTKVNNEKTVVIAESDKDGIADGDALTAAATEANTSGADKFVKLTFEVKAGKYYYFLGEGTNPPIYAIDVEEITGGGDQPQEKVFTLSTKVAGQKDNNVSIAKKGNYIDVDFDITNNPGFNNYTFYITYNPNVVKARAAVVGNTQDYVASNINGEKIKAFNVNDINDSIAFAPAANDSDFAGLGADGTKTSAELGKIKVAYFVNKSADGSSLALVSGDGTLFTIQFEVIGAGDANISIATAGADYFKPAIGSTDKLDLTVEKSDIKVVDDGSAMTIKPVLNPTLDEATADKAADPLLIPNSYVGKDVDVALDVTNNSGFNNYTFFVEYDPTVVELKDAKEGTLKAADTDAIKTNIANVPSTANADYTGLADGVKTQAQLGKVKLAWYKVDYNDPIVTGDGSLVILTFNVLKGAETGTIPTGIKVTFVQDGFRPSMGATSVINTLPIDSGIYVGAAESTESSSEPTSEDQSTDQPSTEQPSSEEPSTETSSETPSEGTTATPGGEGTTAAPGESTTEPTTAVTPGGSTSGGGHGGGGGGGGRSSRKASTSTTEAATEGTTSSSRVTGPSFYVKDKNGNDILIKPPVDIVNPNVEFDDLYDRPWATDAIRKLAQLGIVAGIGNNLYGVDLYCRRADFVIMINNVLGINGTATENFSDVLSGKYYYNAVGLSYQIGISSGYGDGTFKPENYCTREEMMVLVAKTFEFLGENVTSTDLSVLDKYADKDDISFWSAPYTAYLTAEGIVTGTGTNFEPAVNMTRAQMAVMMANVYDYVLDMAYEKEAEQKAALEAEEDETETEEVSEESTEETTEESTESTTEEVTE